MLAPTISEPADLLLGGVEGAPQGEVVALLHPRRWKGLVKLGFLNCGDEGMKGEEKKELGDIKKKEAIKREKGGVTLLALATATKYT